MSPTQKTLARPLDTARSVIGFLEHDSDPHAVAAVVSPELYRQRG